MPPVLTAPETPAVPVRECGEPLVPVPRGVAAPGDRPLVRSGVAARLAVAGLLLPPGRRLLVVAGHRSPGGRAGRGCGTHDAAHAAGAAVDVSLIDRLGRPVDTGSRLDLAPEARDGWSDAAASADARIERRVLVDALAGAGLVPDPVEWWHWSHGDPRWAEATRSPAALYGPVGGPPRRTGDVLR